MDYEAAMDELTAAPAADFTARRQALAKELRQAGDREAAARLLEVRKPAAPVLAANQVARYDPEAVEGLLDAGAELQQAQQAALEGAADGATRLRAAGGGLNTALERVVKRAARLPGAQSNVEATRRLRDLLQAATLGDDATRAALGRGRLLVEPAPLGFGGLGLEAGVSAKPRRQTAAPAAAAPPVKEPSRAERIHLERRARHIAAARERARKAAEEATAAEAQAETLEGQAAVAEEEARRLRREATAARRRAEERRQRADSAGAEVKRL